MEKVTGRIPQRATAWIWEKYFNEKECKEKGFKFYQLGCELNWGKERKIYLFDN